MGKLKTTKPAGTPDPEEDDEELDPVADAIEELGEETKKSIESLTKGLNDATTASKKATDELATVKTELKDVKEKLRHRSTGGYVEDQEKAGFGWNYALRGMYRMQVRGKSQKDAFSEGSEFTRDQILRGLSERRSMLRGVPEEELSDVAKSMLSDSDTSIGSWIPIGYSTFLEIAWPKIIGSQLGIRGPVATFESPILAPKVTQKITFSPTAEGKAPTSQDIKAGMDEFYPKGYTCMTEASIRALELADPSLNDRINSHFTAAYAEMLDSIALMGTGTSGQPLGIANHPSVLTQTSSGTIDYDKLVTIIGKAEGGDSLRYGKLGWASHPTVWAGVMKVKDSQGRPLFANPGAGLPNELLGYPYRKSTQLTVAANNQLLILGDWPNAVWWTWMNGLRINFSQHFKFPQQLVVFLAATDINFQIEYPKAFVVVSDLNL